MPRVQGLDGALIRMRRKSSPLGPMPDGASFILVVDSLSDGTIEAGLAAQGHRVATVRSLEDLLRWPEAARPTLVLVVNNIQGIGSLPLMMLPIYMWKAHVMVVGGSQPYLPVGRDVLEVFAAIARGLVTTQEIAADLDWPAWRAEQVYRRLQEELEARNTAEVVDLIDDLALLVGDPAAWRAWLSARQRKHRSRYTKDHNDI